MKKSRADITALYSWISYLDKDERISIDLDATNKGKAVHTLYIGGDEVAEYTDYEGLYNSLMVAARAIGL